MASKDLNPKQLAFIKEYTLDFNGTQAAIRAGYSKNSANEQASALLAKPSIQAALQKRLIKNDSKIDNLRLKVRQQMEAIAFAKLTDYGTINQSGFDLANNFDQIDPMMQSVIREFHVHDGKDGVQMKIKLSSQEKALEMLGRHLGMFNDKLDVQIAPKDMRIIRPNGEIVELGVEKTEPKLLEE